MIKLTEILELPEQEVQVRPIYVPPDIVVRVWFGKTIIDYSTSSYTVTESPEEVARKVLEYRLAMLNYADGLFKPDAEEHLMKLSGLSAEKGAEG